MKKNYRFLWLALALLALPHTARADLCQDRAHDLVKTYVSIMADFVGVSSFNFMNFTKSTSADAPNEYEADIKFKYVTGPGPAEEHSLRFTFVASHACEDLRIAFADEAP